MGNNQPNANVSTEQKGGNPNPSPVKPNRNAANLPGNLSNSGNSNTNDNATPPPNATHPATTPATTPANTSAIYSEATPGGAKVGKEGSAPGGPLAEAKGGGHGGQGGHAGHGGQGVQGRHHHVKDTSHIDIKKKDNVEESESLSGSNSISSSVNNGLFLGAMMPTAKNKGSDGWAEEKYGIATSLPDESFFYPSERTDFMSVLASSKETDLAPANPSSLSVSLTLSPTFYSELFNAKKSDQMDTIQKFITLLKSSLESPESVQFFKKHLPTLLRFAYEIPPSFVKDCFANFLKDIDQELKIRNIDVPTPLPPSKFFPESSLVPMDTNGPAGAIFEHSLATKGYISHITRVMAWHPIYYHKFLNCEVALMRSELKPLKDPWVHYIGLMAAASFKCGYLVQQQEIEFLLARGDSSWLENRRNLPAKLRNLSEINEILAQQPWRITEKHFENLVKGPDAWTLPELVHALLVLASYRALACFIWGTGITSEIDFKCKDQIHDYSSISPKTSEQNLHKVSEVQNHSTEQLLKKLYQCGNQGDEGEITQNNVQSFLEVENPADKKESCAGNLLESGWSESFEKKYCDHITKMNYSDFETKSPDYAIFHIEDFSWAVNGFSLVNRLFVPAALVIDETFKCIRSLTYKNFGNSNDSVDTGPFRLAIWYYVHRVFGIFYDDYNYHNVNVFVSQPIKSFTKLMACVPSRIKKSDLDFGIDLLPDEKVHIALLVMEARKSAEMLYALRILSKLNRN